MKAAHYRVAAVLTVLILLGVGGAPLAPHSIGHAAHLTVAPAPARGGTVIDGLFAEPDRLIPNTSTLWSSGAVAQTLFAPLFYTDDQSRLQPGLAAEIPSLANGDISHDGRTYIFKLRPGLQWSDGQPLDARDVDYSWKTWTNKDLIVATRLGLDQISSATLSTDNLSITFHLKAPYAPFVSIWTDLALPLPAHVLSKMSAQDLNTSAFTFSPTVSSGPFMIVSRTKGDSIVEVRNPHYYQPGRPYLDKLIFRMIPDQVALTNALSAHEIDCAWFLSVAQLHTLQHIDGYTLVVSPHPGSEEGVLNLRNPILQDVRVRQALEYGLDRFAMVRDVWRGLATPLASNEPPTMFSYTPGVKPYPFDPARAARLLDAAGWKLGPDGHRHKDGTLLSLRYSTTSRNAWRAQDELIALQDFRNLGIDLRIVNYPSDTYIHILSNGDYDIGEIQFFWAYDPDVASANVLQSNRWPPHGSNYSHYSSTAYDALLATEESATDVARRRAIFARMQRLLNHDLPSLWLYSPPTLAAHSNTLHNYAPASFSGETWNTWNWWKD